MIINSLNKLKEIFPSSINFNKNKKITGFEFDSRNLKNGNVFLALKAERDGHDFIPSAIKNEAVACLVEKSNEKLDIPQFVTKSTWNALEKIANISRKNFKGKVIAVTGSAGKTTNRSMIENCLENSYATKGNFNGILGLPLTLAHLDENADFAVLELGTDKIGNINKLTNIAKPDIAIVTSIGPAHMEFFKTIENIEDEKLSIANGLSENGVLIIPHYLKEKAQKITNKKIVTFSFDDKNADSYAESVSEEKIAANIQGQKIEFTLEDISEYKVTNALIAFSVMNCLGLDSAKAVEKIENFKALGGRGEKFELSNNITVIDEAYNANPLSMKNTLESFKLNSNKEFKIAVLSDMLELGESEIKLHQELAEPCKDIDYVYTVGPLMSSLSEKLLERNQKTKHFESTKDFIKFLKQTELSDCNILVKGSKSTLISESVEFLKMEYKK